MPPNTAINISMTWYEWLLLVTLSILWGGSFFFIGVAVRELPAFTITVARVAPAAIALLLVMRMAGQRLPRGMAAWKAFAGMGFLNNVVPFSMITWGQKEIASGVASIIIASTPLLTVVFAHFTTTDEKMTGGRLVGVCIGLAGVAVMVGGDLLGGMSPHALALGALLVAAMSYAAASIYGRRFRALGVQPMATATGQVPLSSLMLIPMMLVVDRPWNLPVPSATTIAALAGLALLATSLGYVIYFRILATAGATNLALVTFLIPVSAILLGTTFLDEVLLPKHLMGMALIGLGMAAVDGRPWKRITAMRLFKGGVK